MFYKSRQSKKAFTLAEVLITLAIIGVVAALTIPNLIKNYQKHQTVEKLKKVYSTLQQAIKLSEVENGYIANWSFPSSNYSGAQVQDFVNQYLIPYLNVAKDCNLQGDCWASVSYRLNGKDANHNINTLGRYKTVLLADGTIVAFAGREGLVQVMVDINGKTNPNTQGIDIFGFIIVPLAGFYNRGDGNLLSYVKIGGIYPDGSGMARSYIIANQYRGCNKIDDYPYMGLNCTALIMEHDGWQIKKDYPWD